MKPSNRELLTIAGPGILAGAVDLVIARMATAPVEALMPAWVPFVPWLAATFGLMFRMGRRSLPA